MNLNNLNIANLLRFTVAWTPTGRDGAHSTNTCHPYCDFVAFLSLAARAARLFVLFDKRRGKIWG